MLKRLINHQVRTLDIAGIEFHAGPSQTNAKAACQAVLLTACQGLATTRYHRQWDGSAGDIAVFLKAIGRLLGRDFHCFTYLLVNELVGLVQQQQVNALNIDVDSVDLLLLHQANKFIDEKIRKSVKIPAEKTPYCLEEYGNVTSASIPLTMVSRCREQLSGPERHCLACGFGVGLAWASMEFYAGDVTISDMITY